MKIRCKTIMLAVLLIGAIAMLAPQAALALGTAAGTDVINNVSVTYDVNTQAQTPKTATTTFKVDDKVMFTLTTSNIANVTVLPNAQAYETYVLTNTGNGPHDFTLVTTATGTNNLVPAAGPAFYSDLGSTLLPNDAPVAGTPQYISNLASDATMTVYLYITAPPTPTDGQAVAYVVTATAYQVGSATSSAAQSVTDAGLDKNTNLNTVYVVVADGAGNGNGVSGVTDINYDGKYTRLAKDAGNNTVGFTVTSANITVAKASAVTKDGFGGPNPKAIPGATITYTLTVTNTGSAGTTALAMDDTLPNNVTFVGYDGGVGPTCVAPNIQVDNVCSLATIVPGPPFVHVTMSGLNVTAAGGATPSHTIKYSVTIN